MACMSACLRPLHVSGTNHATGADIQTMQTLKGHRAGILGRRTVAERASEQRCSDSSRDSLLIRSNVAYVFENIAPDAQ